VQLITVNLASLSMVKVHISMGRHCWPLNIFV